MFESRCQTFSLSELAPDRGDSCSDRSDDHLFDVLGIGLVDIFGAAHLAMVLAVDFGQDVASKRGTAFDLAAFFDLEALDSAFDTFHFRHRRVLLSQNVPIEIVPKIHHIGFWVEKGGVLYRD